MNEEEFFTAQTPDPFPNSLDYSEIPLGPEKIITSIPKSWITASFVLSLFSYLSSILLLVIGIFTIIGDRISPDNHPSSANPPIILNTTVNTNKNENNNSTELYKKQKINITTNIQDTPKIARGFVFIIAGIFISLLIFPQYIIHLILLHKTWKMLQPLRSTLPPEDQYNLLTPGKAVGFLFIPFFNCYWVFPAHMGISSMGKRYAQCKQLPYVGPSDRLSLGLPIACAVSCTFSLIAFSFPFFIYMLDKRYNAMIQSSYPHQS